MGRVILFQNCDKNLSDTLSDPNIINTTEIFDISIKPNQCKIIDITIFFLYE